MTKKSHVLTFLLLAVALKGGPKTSYDIVVKVQAGKIDVKTKENEFTEFIINLPVL